MRKGLFPALVVFLGCSGAFQIDVVKLHPSEEMRIGAVVLTAFALILSVVLARDLDKFAIDGGLRELFANPSWHSDRRWQLSRKAVAITVSDVGGAWRDTDLRYELEIQNRRRKHLSTVPVPVAADNRVRRDDMNPRVRIDGGAVVSPRIIMHSAYSPTIQVDFDAPGLKRGRTALAVVDWHCPSMTHLREGAWSCQIQQVALGSPYSLTVTYPPGKAQSGHVIMIKRLGPIRWARSIGSVLTTTSGAGEVLHFGDDKHRFEALLVIEARAR